MAQDDQRDQAAYRSMLPELRARVEPLRRRLKRGDPGAVIVWAVENRIAISPRPLRYHPDPSIGHYVDRISTKGAPLVEVWTDEVLRAGVHSVLCLATDKELSRYEQLDLHDGGLLGYLEARGLKVVRVPLSDPAHLKQPGLSWKETELKPAQELALKVFPELPPAVLIFCSGCADRSPPIAAHIASALNLALAEA